MPTHHFTLIVDGADLQDESVVNSLFESGCDDALVGSTDGVQFIDFDRDAANLDAAVLSAVADAKRVDGIRVLRVANAGLTSMRDIAARTGRARDRETTKLVADLAEKPSVELFNPWYEFDKNDRSADCPAIRRDQLIHYLTTRLDHARILLIAEAAGYQGARFTGIAMTSERILRGGLKRQGIMPCDVLPGLKPCRTSAASTALPKTVQQMGFTEPTATIVWSTMLSLGVTPLDFVLWNAVPWHPYDARRERLSNRSPTAQERDAGRQYLKRVIALYPNASLVAVGNVAKRQLSDLGDARYVRHPANGGARAFRHKMAHILTDADGR